jgi:hypothetical protein
MLQWEVMDKNEGNDDDLVIHMFHVRNYSTGYLGVVVYTVSCSGKFNFDSLSSNINYIFHDTVL